MNTENVNWKTTLAGLVTAVFFFIAQDNTIQFPLWMESMANWVVTGGLGAIGWFAKDANNNQGDGK